MNEFSEEFPWRKVFIGGQDQSPGKRPQPPSRFAAAAAEPADDCALRDTSVAPKFGINDVEPSLSSADFSFGPMGRISERKHLIPKVFLGLVTALFLAIAIPGLFTKESSEPRTSARYRPAGPVAFAGPAGQAETCRKERPWFRKNHPRARIANSARLVQPSTFERCC